MLMHGGEIIEAENADDGARDVRRQGRFVECRVVTLPAEVHLVHLDTEGPFDRVRNPSRVVFAHYVSPRLSQEHVSRELRNTLIDL